MSELFGSLKPFVEIGIIWFILYVIILFIRGTRAVQVLSGLGILIFASFLAQRFGLNTINWVLTKVFAFGAIAFLILFLAGCFIEHFLQQVFCVFADIFLLFSLFP